MELKHNKSKKGQFYVVTAIVLSLAVFSAVNSINLPESYEDPMFASIANNFINEAPIVINSALHSNHNLTTKFEEFEIDFLKYLKSLNSNVGFLYMLKEDDNIIIKNNLNKDIKIITFIETISLQKNGKVNLKQINSLKLNIDETLYNYEFNKNFF